MLVVVLVNKKLPVLLDMLEVELIVVVELVVLVELERVVINAVVLVMLVLVASIVELVGELLKYSCTCRAC